MSTIHTTTHVNISPIRQLFQFLRTIGVIAVVVDNTSEELCLQHIGGEVLLRNPCHDLLVEACLILGFHVHCIGARVGYFRVLL